MTTKTLKALKEVRIGSQIWTVENLSLPIDGSVCYDHDPGNCIVFGQLYTYNQALEVVKKYPGWRLPTREDVDILIKFLGGTHISGREIKIGGSSGFNALLAGYREAKNGKFYRIYAQTGFWTSTPDGENLAWKFYVAIEDDDIKFHPVSKKYGDSIRLIKEENKLAN